LDVAVDAELVALHQIAFLLGRGKHDYGDRFRPRVTFHRLEDLQAVYFWKLQVEQHKLRRGLEAAAGKSTATEKEIQGFFSVANHLNLAGDFAFLKSVKSQFRVGRIVFYQENLNRIRLCQGPPPLHILLETPRNLSADFAPKVNLLRVGWRGESRFNGIWAEN
jgi:hypothetical protein